MLQEGVGFLVARGLMHGCMEGLRLPQWRYCSTGVLSLKTSSGYRKSRLKQCSYPARPVQMLLQIGLVFVELKETAVLLQCSTGSTGSTTWNVWRYDMDRDELAQIMHKFKEHVGCQLPRAFSSMKALRRGTTNGCCNSGSFRKKPWHQALLYVKFLCGPPG